MSGWQRLAILGLCTFLLAAGLPLRGVSAAPSFPDVPGGTPAATAIGELAARGIVRGYGDGLFRPAAIVERRQMAATLVRALGWSGRTPTRNFPDQGDTDNELWDAMRILADAGVVRGFPDGTAAPGTPLTRQQALSVITRAFVAAGAWPAAPAASSPFGDVAPDHQGDVARYIGAAGLPPTVDGTTLGAELPADRAWYAQVLWPAVRGREAGGASPAAPAPASPAASPAPAVASPAPASPAASSAPAATSPAVAASGPRFGVAAHFLWHSREQTTAEVERIAAAGLTTARFDLSWKAVEPQRKGVYDQEFLDRIDSTLAKLDARGIAPIITVIETPTWARPAGTGPFTPPTNRQDYADLLGMLAARYAGRAGMTWEIWNEPNLVEFWATGPNAADYADMLRRSYRAIKAVDPDATVLGGAIAFGDLPYLNALYAAGAGGAFDGLSIHPYTAGRAPTDDSVAWFSLRGQFGGMRAAMAAHGDGAKPLYATEFGWSTDDVSDAQRADYMREAVAIMRTIPGLRAAAAYTINAADYPSFGLITAAGAETTTWKSYTAAAR